MQIMTRFLFAAAIAITAPFSLAHAQMMNDRFWAEASLFLPHIDSSVAVTAKANPAIGTKINLEDDLGLDSHQELPAFLAGWRISKRFALVGEYFSIGRDASRTLDRNINFDGVTYRAATTINSSYHTNVYRLTINWSIVRKSTFEAGLALGLHATKFDLGIDGIGSVGNQVAQSQRRAEDFLAPLPTIGAFANVEFVPGVMLGGRVDYLSLKIDEYDGRLMNIQGRVSYRAFKNVGIGVGYRYVDYRVDVDKPRYDGRFEYAFSGPAIFLEAGF